MFSWPLAYNNSLPALHRAMTDHDHSVHIPAGTCALFPSEFCIPELEELYGLERNETSGRWGGACLGRSFPCCCWAGHGGLQECGRAWSGCPAPSGRGVPGQRCSPAACLLLRLTHPIPLPGSCPSCELERWLVPGACILPTPLEVMMPLGRWERTSEKLVVNDQAKEAMRWVGLCVGGWGGGPAGAGRRGYGLRC